MIPTTVAVLQIIIPVILIAPVRGAATKPARVDVVSGRTHRPISRRPRSQASGWCCHGTALVYLSVVAVGVRYRACDLRTLRWRPVGRLAYVELGVCVLFVAGAVGCSFRRLRPGAHQRQGASQPIVSR